MTEYLSREEEVELGKKAMAGDYEARDEIVLNNLRFVESVARRYNGRGVPLEDLIQEGLHFALRSFNYYRPERPTRFKTLGWWWVRRGIFECIAKDDVVKPPSKGYKDEDPRGQGTSSLNVPNQLGQSMAEAIEDHHEEAALDILVRKDQKSRVTRAIATLPQRKRDIVRMRFGICLYREAPKDPMSLAEIGNHYGITAERARQILVSALDELRVKLVG